LPSTILPFPDRFSLPSCTHRVDHLGFAWQSPEDAAAGSAFMRGYYGELARRSLRWQQAYGASLARARLWKTPKCEQHFGDCAHANKVPWAFCGMGQWLFVWEELLRPAHIESPHAWVCGEIFFASGPAYTRTIVCCSEALRPQGYSVKFARAGMDDYLWGTTSAASSAG